jgi:hypothetical protein
MSVRKVKAAPPRRKTAMDPLLETVVRRIESPERMLELLYWSREPELLDAMRVIAAMPAAAQAKLCAFLAMAADAPSIKAEFDGAGKLTLSSPQIAAALAEVVEIRETRIEINPDFAPRIH